LNYSSVPSPAYRAIPLSLELTFFTVKLKRFLYDKCHDGNHSHLTEEGILIIERYMRENGEWT
jgi:hypothetical protein